MSNTDHRLYIDSLDGMRAFAVLLVFFAHAGFGDVIPGGFGVTVFFFLSGYLIATLLRLEFEKTGGINFKGFYLRRAYRIFPPFYIALLAGLLIAYAIGDTQNFDVFSVVAQSLHLTNYYLILFGNQIIPSTGVFWSLAVEEHYYLVFPLILLFFLNRFSLMKITMFFLLFCVIALVWRFYLVVALEVPANHTNIASDTRIDSILYGCILGVWMNPVLDKEFIMSERNKVLMLGVAIFMLLFTFVYRDPTFRESLRYSLQGVALMPVFYLAVNRSEWLVFKVLNWNVVKYMGKISFSFYLFHMMVIHLVVDCMLSFDVENRYLTMFVSFFITSFISILLYVYVEKRFALMRKKMRHDV